MRAFLDELAWRGLIHDQTPGLAARVATGRPMTAYVGFDPTAPSLQVGNLVPVMLLAHLQRAGGRPIVVMGGGTGMIGDPSGKSSERPLLSPDDLAANIREQKRQFEQILPGVIMVDNAEWLRKLELVEFLRDIGKHFTLSYMLQKESVKARLEAGISFTEFSYMLLQAYDFLQLFRQHDCEMQMGGSDQWGNITAGIELIRRLTGGEAQGLSAPLVTTSTGAKFGKTEGKAVWLAPRLTPAHTFYNFWVNTDDRDVEKYLRMFTFLPREDITALMRQHAAEPGQRIPHHALALSVTSLVHGPEAGRETARGVREAFAARGSDDLRTFIEQVVSTHAVKDIAFDEANPPRVEELFVRAGLAASNGEARRLLAGNGLYVNREVREAGTRISLTDAVKTGAGELVLLQKGKKTFQPVRLTRGSPPT